MTLSKETAPTAIRAAVSNKQQLKDTALSLARQGIPNFPCSHTKAPTCQGGFKSATADIAANQKLWIEYPGSLIGVQTGPASGFDVLDIDIRHGGHVWLYAHEDKLPRTRRHQTRSGGYHLFFKHHPGLRNSTSKLALGVDVRADGGCAIWWPASGFPVLDDAPIAAWPDWIIQKLLPPPRPHFVVSCDSFKHLGTAYTCAALRHAALRVSNAPEGTRNATLNREVWSLMRFCAQGALSLQEMATALSTAALAVGLSRQEIVSTIASAMRARGIS